MGPRRRSVRIFFLALLPLLFLQFGIAELYGYFLRHASNSHRRHIMALSFASPVAAAREGPLREWTRERCRALTGREDVAALVVERVVATRDAWSAQVVDREVRERFRMELE